MVAEIITIGDELLIGQVVDTNSAWIASKLNDIGIDVYQVTSIPDESSRIVKAIEEARTRVDVVLMTGGLGPTKDDITKHTLTDYFSTELVVNKEVLTRIRDYFKSKGLENLEVNDHQALLPKSAEILQNYRGTASGMWFEQQETIFISMPGVPYEMKGLMRDHVLVKLKAHNKDSYIRHKTINTCGIGESFLAKTVQDWEDSLESDNISVAYLPSLSFVKVRLSKSGDNKELIDDVIEKKATEFVHLAKEYVFGFDDQTIEEIVGDLLREKDKTLAVAESCTGGNIAKMITSVSGSSDYFLGSAVTYATESKIDILGVLRNTINEKTVVSEEVAQEMAVGVRKLFGSDFGLSTTGYAEPDPDNGIHVGLVCVGISAKSGDYAFTIEMGRNRNANIERFAFAALNALRQEILR